MLPAGTYTLTITDSDSCQQEFVFEVDFINATENKSIDGMAATLVPNPSFTNSAAILSITLDQSQPITLEVCNATGANHFFGFPEYSTRRVCLSIAE